MKLHTLLLAALLAALPPLPAAPARAGEPPTAPILRIETGMHTASIGRIATDAANRYLVTASHDKTVRVWSLTDGRLLQTLRPPIGRGDEGKLYVVALSPDGQTVACGGWTGGDWDGTASIYLFERASGRLVRRLGGLPNVVNHLTFSPDGRFLAAALGSGGLRVFRVADGSLAGQDTTYGDNDGYGVAFDHTGRLATSCYDGYLRLYDASFKLLVKQKAPGGSQPSSVSFSSDGALLAVGFRDSTRVNVLSGTDLSLRYAPDTVGVDNGNLSRVAFSADGRFLYAGGRWRQSNGYPIRRWEAGGQGRYSDFLSGADNTIFDLCPLQGGGVAFGAADPAWGVLEATGRRSLGQGPPIADLRSNLDGFQLAADGAVAGFGYAFGGEVPARFNVAERALQAVGQPKLLSLLLPSLAPPRTQAPGLTITDWEDTNMPKLNGTPLKLEPYERSRSLTIAPDGSRFLLGTEWWLRCFDRAGQEAWKVPAPSAAWAVNVAGNGQVCAAAFGDGTIRWYRMSDGQELLALFPHADRKRWVLWTPSGYHDCSPGGEDLIGWHVNRGKDQAADFFPASKFHDTFYRPDVIAHVLETLDEAAAVRLANAESQRRHPEADATTVLQQQPPVVRIVSPVDGATVTGNTVTVQVLVRTPSGEPVTTVRALVDGRPAGQPRAVNLVARSPEGEVLTLTVPMPAKGCQLAILADNRFSASEPALVSLQWGGGAAVEEFKPKLYVLAIGISRYADATLNLRYAAKDAQDFAAALKAQEGGLYRAVEVKLLTDADATRDNIVDGLDWIEHQTTSRDMAMVFLSGHGDNAPSGDYYFLPHNFDRARIKRTGVAFSDIQNTVKNLAGKALFFVDSCHSGNVMGPGQRKGAGDINAVVNELSSAENGAVVFAASTGRQFSFEKPEWGNGAFTKAVVEGLTGQAQAGVTGRITVKSLDFYISERVKALTDGQQTPTTTIPPTVPDFPVAVKR